MEDSQIAEGIEWNSTGLIHFNWMERTRLFSVSTKGRCSLTGGLNSKYVLK